jgi:hypothetical protein
MAKDANEMRRRIAFDAETYLALDRLARDRMASLQELADEAFRDLLKKHRRPVTLNRSNSACRSFTKATRVISGLASTLISHPTGPRAVP